MILITYYVFKNKNVNETKNIFFIFLFFLHFLSIAVEMGGVPSGVHLNFFLKMGGVGIFFLNHVELWANWFVFIQVLSGKDVVSNACEDVADMDFANLFKPDAQKKIDERLSIIDKNSQYHDAKVRLFWVGVRFFWF